MEKFWITYTRKKVNDKKYIDPEILGLIANIPYNNPNNELQFLGYFETDTQEEVSEKIELNKDYNIELIDDINAILDSWCGEEVFFDGEKIIDNREVIL